MTKELKYELALFAGIGGGILGGLLSGLQCIGSVESNTYSNGVLLRRQNEGYLSPFPVWDDIRTFRTDNPETSGFIKHLRRISGNLIISGGFPCQDISRAGKGKGLEGENSGLWYEFYRVLCEIRPRAALLENSTSLNNRGLDRILWLLAKEGYNAVWDVFGANDTGAPQIRHRMWILAYTDSMHVRGKWDNRSILSKTAKSKEEKSRIFTVRSGFSYAGKIEKSGVNWLPEPEVGRMVDGFPYRLVQRERLGNAQVPAVAAMALRELLKYTDISIHSLGNAGMQPSAAGDSNYTACHHEAG